MAGLGRAGAASKLRTDRVLRRFRDLSQFRDHTNPRRPRPRLSFCRLGATLSLKPEVDEMSATLSLEGGQRRSSGWQWRMRLKWQRRRAGGLETAHRSGLRRFRDLPAVSASGKGVTARGAGELSQAEVGVSGNPSSGHQRRSSDSSLMAISASAGARAMNCRSRWRVGTPSEQVSGCTCRAAESGSMRRPVDAGLLGRLAQRGGDDVGVAVLAVPAELHPAAQPRMQGQQHLRRRCRRAPAPRR